MLDAGGPQQDLDGLQISRCLVDERGPGSAHRMPGILALVEARGRHPLIKQGGILSGADMAHVIHPTGKMKSFKVPFGRSNQASRLLRASAMISNCTGRPVFCWMTVARLRIVPPLTRSPMRSLTRSHPRNLLSIARSKRARSRSRLCSSR